MRANRFVRICVEHPIPYGHWRARIIGPAAAAPALDPPHAFGLGNAGDISCPAGTVKMTSEAACKNAAAVGGRFYGGGVTASVMPGGCGWLTIGGSFYFNSNTSGGGNAAWQPVCAGTPACINLQPHMITSTYPPKLYMYLPSTNPTSCLPIYLPMCLSISLSVRLSICPALFLSIYPLSAIRLTVHLSNFQSLYPLFL